MEIDLKELTQIPEEIRKLRYELLKIDEKIKEIQLKRNEIIQGITEAVVNAKDENGKPKYKNEMSRRAEIEKRKLQNKELEQLDKEYMQLLKKKDTTRFEIELLYNKMKTYEILAILKKGD